MFKEMAEKLKSLVRMPVPFDPSRLNDPVALQTEWTPARGGGANFRTHKLVQVDFHRIEFRATVGNKLFCSIFLVVGLAVMVGVTLSELSKGKSVGTGILFPIVFGFIFAGIGGAMLYFTTQPIVFDTRRGYYWKGRKSPAEASDRSALKNFAQLSDIHAIQLVSEHCHSKKSSYYSYELNLVMKDGKRLNVVDHGNRGKMLDDANTLSRFLGKPVWDAM